MSEYIKLMRECYEQTYVERWRENSESLRQHAWETAWDASRATLVVELPKPYLTDFEGEQFLHREAVREEIVKAGVTVK